MINLEILMSGILWCYLSCGIFSRIDAKTKTKTCILHSLQKNILKFILNQKELRNYILRIILVIIFSIQAYISLHFLPVILGNTLFVFVCFICFLSVMSFEFDVIFIELQHLYNHYLYYVPSDPLGFYSHFIKTISTV